MSRAEEHLTESGLYKLVISYTGDSWESRGLVYRVGDDNPIADIKRNYSWFVWSFVEDHPNGHPYLVAGQDYQGQTVIELDTGRRRDFLPDDAKHGFGFCWTDHRFHPGTQLLIVSGCIWAAPFEYRFYDFADPMEKGWPELEFEGAYEDGKWPEIGDDGLIRTYGVERESDDAEENVPIQDRGTSEISTYRRHGNELRFVSRWRSQAEQARLRKRAEQQRAYDAWEADFKATDPLYLEYRKQIKDQGLTLDDYMSRGVTYEDWCPTFKGDEARWCRTIITTDTVTMQIEWAVKTGPIKLVINHRGVRDDDVFFDHSADAMAEAFAYAKAVASGAPIAIEHPWSAPDMEADM